MGTKRMRVRDRLVQRRTAFINQIRGFLLERGITFAQGPANLRRHLPSLLEDADQDITPRMRTLLAHLWPGAPPFVIVFHAQNQRWVPHPTRISLGGQVEPWRVLLRTP